MKYAAIVRYSNGERTGATVSANSMLEAWQKLMKIIPFDHVQAVEIAEILTPERSAD